VIVLDNLLNFQELERSQQVSPGMDRSYPEAYSKMSETNFAGDFIALVARGDDLDHPLVEIIEKKWNEVGGREATVPERDGSEHGGNAPREAIEPRLIKFIHNVNNAQSEGYIHFLKSDQTSFWNYKSNTIAPYPAILLTDTRSLRSPICPQTSSCDIFDRTTSPRNLEFAHRITQTVYDATVTLQSGASAVFSTFLTVPLLLLSLRFF